MRPQHIGVVIGRFQAPALHEGHRYIIAAAQRRFKTLLIVVGSPRSLATKRNPLDFATRRAMLHAAYPEATIVEQFDCKLDEVWSHNLDQLIERTFPSARATLFGSRDSFIPHYSGRHTCVTVKPRDETISATNVRNAIIRDPPQSEDFRSGVIHAVCARPPLSYQTVDIAILSNDRMKVLLAGRKREPGFKRFIGGFVDAKDESLERAAMREVYEETNGMEIGNLRYLSSLRVDDWRYARAEDKIMTAFFVGDYIFGSLHAGDDIDSLSWVDVYEELMQCITPEHKPLAQHLIASLTQ